ncbi:hypothetical protein BDQ17DRAFT_971205 [Cyathus striatus]|nr:hypothetical protein BDQ17DRAFT_971205 [Cyathus striatus]
MNERMVGGGPSAHPPIPICHLAHLKPRCSVIGTNVPFKPPLPSSQQHIRPLSPPLPQPFPIMRHHLLALSRSLSVGGMTASAAVFPWACCHLHLCSCGFHTEMLCFTALPRPLLFSWDAITVVAVWLNPCSIRLIRVRCVGVNRRSGVIVRD